MKNFLSYLLFSALLFAAPAVRAQDSTIKSAGLFSYAGVPAGGTSEIDTLTIQSGTSAGSFTITVAGSRTTSAITWSATDATLISRIDAALEALSIIGTGGVTVAAGTGTSGIGTYTITLTGKNARMDFPLLSIGTNSLTGGTAPTLTTTTAGVAATWKDAPTGQLLVNSTNGSLYQNTSTTAGSPTWVEIVGIAVATSADLRGMLSDETGTGVAVFGTSPAITSQVVTTGLTASGSASNDFSASTGTMKTSTGLFTVSGPGAVSTTTLSGPGAISVVKGTTKVTSTGVADALTLANGTDGQIITVIHDVDGGSAVLTPTTKTGFTTVTFTAVGESVTLQYVTTRGWIILAINGAVAA